MTSLKHSMKDADVTIYPPDGKTWDDVYDIQLVVNANNGGMSFNLGIHIPFSAMWKSRVSVTSFEWFEIAIPHPYIEAKFTLVVWIEDEKIRLNVHRVNNETGEREFKHKITDIYAVECSLVNTG